MTSKFLRLFKRRRSGSPAEPLSMPATSVTALPAAADARTELEQYDARIAASASDAEAHYKRANVLNRLGNLELALRDYDAAVELNSSYAIAFCNRGAVLGRLGQWDAALASYDRAIELDPQDAISFYNRAVALKELARPDDALVSCHRAVEIRVDYVEAHINKGSLLKESGRLDEAMASYDAAIAISTQHAESYLGRGLVLAAQQAFEEARHSFDRAIELRPEFAEALVSRGNALRELHRFDTALADYGEAIRLSPRLRQGYTGRALTFYTMNRFSEAVADYNQAEILDPDVDAFRSTRTIAQMFVNEWSNLQADLAFFREALDGGRPACNPFGMLGLLDAPELHRKAAELWVAEECPPDDALGSITASERRAKIRVGYFSGDFREHPVAQLLVEVLEAHDRSLFEVFAFSFGPESNDPMRHRLIAAVDRFVDVRNLSDLKAASLAREAGIDIAVDLAGYTAYCRTGMFALRAAPVQISYLGYPGTMSSEYIDYLMADATVVPLKDRHHYGERIIYLPGCYLPVDSKRAISTRTFTRQELQLPPSGFVFCCFNNSYKILPDVFDSWMRILGRVEGSVLWLSAFHPTAIANLREQAKLRGIEPERLIFAGRIPDAADHIARLACADLFLDTLPYNAHATAVDAMWAGVPVVSLAGRSFAGRVGASLLTAVGLTELIALSREEYEDLAVALASDAALLRTLRERLAHSRTSASLFDVRRLTRNIESGYQRVYSRNLAGLAPDDIVIDDAGPQTV